jgi:hypothetical protein
VKVPSIKADDPGAAPDMQAFAEVPPETAPVAAPRSPIAYPGALWRGELPLSLVLWRDMALVGTVVNIAAMGAAFFAIALGASMMTFIVIHFLPVPYNIFLVAAVWRAAERAPAEQAWMARIVSVLWLFVAFVI